MRSLEYYIEDFSSRKRRRWPRIVRRRRTANVGQVPRLIWVKTAVIQTLIEGGYALGRKDDENLTIGHRGKISGQRDWLLRRRLDTG